MYSSGDKSGYFSTDGITVTAINNSFVQCASNHLTSFAVLVDVSGVSRKDSILRIGSCKQIPYLMNVKTALNEIIPLFFF